MRDRHDADARSIGARTRAEWAEARRGRQVAAARRSSERATAALDQIAVDRELGRSVFARYEPSPARYLAVREQAPLCVQQRLLLRPPALVLGRADRIWVTGPNGAGKSSLIAAMLDSLRVPPRQVFHLPQELGEEQAGAALARLRRLADAERSELLAIVAALGVAPERLLSTPRPSPGQARKLLIAEALARRVWGLVLDEPTNHLDLPSIERLERALAEYPGALLLVTHDQALARRCTSACWLVEDGGVTVSAPS
jgi:ATPase subunit of ABC transporter with duplicated ATPase domains